MTDTVRSSVEPWREPAGDGPGARIVSLTGRPTAGVEAARGASAAPHPEQNFCPGAVGSPHSGHDVTSAAPHSMQNLAPGALSVPQCGQTVT
jgi:hypothetical protein